MKRVLGLLAVLLLMLVIIPGVSYATEYEYADAIGKVLFGGDVLIGYRLYGDRHFYILYKNGDESLGMDPSHLEGADGDAYTCMGVRHGTWIAESITTGSDGYYIVTLQSFDPSAVNLTWSVDGTAVESDNKSIVFDGSTHTISAASSGVSLTVNVSTNPSGDIRNADTYTATASFADTRFSAANPTFTLTINPFELTNANTTITPAQAEYTGKQIKPAVTVTAQGFSNALAETTEYTVAYGENINAGDGAGSLTVTGTGNFKGSASATFSISRKSVADASLAAIGSQVYTGSAITPVPQVSVVFSTGESHVLTAGEFDYRYTDNVNPGDAPVLTISGKGNFCGEATFTHAFEIVPKDLGDLSGVSASVEDPEYTGSPLTPAVHCTYLNQTLTPGKDFTAAYSNNINVTTADSKAIVTLTGIGSYTGTRLVLFNITKINQAAPAAPAAADVTGTTVTLKALENGEYSMDGSSWQSGNVFTGLKCNTEYTFFQRLKEDGIHYASPSASAQIRTAGHKTAAVAAVKATCTEPGNAAYWYCTNDGCGKFFSDEKGGTEIEKDSWVIPAGHTVVTDPAVAATCAKKGLTEGTHCSACGTVLTAQKETPALGHLWVKWDADGDWTHTIKCARGCGEKRTVNCTAIALPVMTADGNGVSFCPVCGYCEGAALTAVKGVKLESGAPRNASLRVFSVDLDGTDSYIVITFEQGGEPVQPDGEVTFTLPDSLKDGSYTLVGEDGTETALGTENGKLTLNFQPDGQDPVQVMILKKN